MRCKRYFPPRRQADRRSSAQKSQFRAAPQHLRRGPRRYREFSGGSRLAVSRQPATKPFVSRRAQGQRQTVSLGGLDSVDAIARAGDFIQPPGFVERFASAFDGKEIKARETQ